jgi:cytochrome c-type biogenesis protein CcmH/NrfG
MLALLAANVWHWWLGVVLTLVALGAVAALGVGYLQKVTAPQHPNRRQRKQLEQ